MKNSKNIQMLSTEELENISGGKLLSSASVIRGTCSVLGRMIGGTIGVGAGYLMGRYVGIPLDKHSSLRVQMYGEQIILRDKSDDREIYAFSFGSGLTAGIIYGDQLGEKLGNYLVKKWGLEKEKEKNK